MLDQRGLYHRKLARKHPSGNYSRSSNTSTKKKKEEIRVGCPFYKAYPTYNQRYACRGKGFDEMGKLK
jgi:predicted ATP-dependent Lon-type protease